MKNLSCSKEDYLRALLTIDSGYGAHSVDIAQMLNVSRASVSKMMTRLKEDGYVSKERYSSIRFTDKGRRVAQHIEKKYELLKNFFHNYLGVDEETAQKKACAIEHCISLEMLELIYDKLDMCKCLDKGGVKHEI